MMRLILGFITCLFCFQNINAAQASISEIYLGSREGDPASLVENVSTIHGDYSEVEIDVTVQAPDSLILSRFYSSKDVLQTATFGGWRFNPHCFLTMQKDPRGKNYSTAEGKFERTLVYVGNPDGTILTYNGWKNASSQKRTLFKIDAEGEATGIANTAKGSISSWTNLKNNELYFNPSTNDFELNLCSGGKRIYVKTPSKEQYLINYEVLPSGNKIFYEFNEQGQLSLIRETNAAEKKTLGWIKIQYTNGIHVETSDGKTVDYHFQKNSDRILLTEVIRSDKPPLYYQYQVIDDHALLLKKELPEGRFIQLDYYTDKTNKYKIKSVTTPSGVNGTTSTQFVYQENYTEIYGPNNRKSIYRYDDTFQLTAIEQYLDGSLYRIDKKYWGKKRNAGNLSSTVVEDGNGNAFYCKTFTYDDRNNGNIVEEREYGNLTGGDRKALVLDEEGILTSDQEPHLKTYSYSYGDKEDVVIQKDSKGNGIEFAYKKGTNLLIRKSCLNGNKLKKRWLYDYNSDAVLVRIQVDDGYETDPKSISYVSERLITTISPKPDIPYTGAPEILEEKYLDLKSKAEILLKRVVNQFDEQGNIVLQEIYDANGEHSYSIQKGYKNGLLIFETDPIGNETHYSYDANQNLLAEQHSASGITIEYGYDLKNRLISTIQHGKRGEKFDTHINYDAAGNKICETDRFGNATTYIYDELGRMITAIYPKVRDGENSFKQPTYSFTYDLFNHETSARDPKGEITTKIFTVHGKPTEIRYPDGTRELFKYDPEGSLHRHCDRDGTVKIFEYDYLGRVLHIERYGRSTKSSGMYLGSLYCTYNALHKLTEKDESGMETTYVYDNAGRLSSMSIETNSLTFPMGNSIIASSARESRKVNFTYDALGRVEAVKNWKSADIFTLQIKEYDLLNRVTQERTEDQTGTILLKNLYTYDQNGHVGQVIGYPQNQQSVLTQYQYDGLGRISKIFDAFGHSTQIVYDDHYINQLGQRVLKRSQIDPLGNCKEEIFDTEDNLVKVLKKDKNNQILAETEFVYDSNGNKILEKSPVISEGQRLRTYSTAWSYGSGDQLSSVTRAATSPEERTIKFNYNSWGELINQIPPRAKDPLIYDYNVEGQLASISYKNPGSAKATIYEIFYDRIGNIDRIKLNSSDFLTSKFNNKGQLLAESFKDEWGIYEVRSFYNGDDHIQSVQLPDASFIDYTYEGPLVKSVTRRSKDKNELYIYEVADRDLMGHSLNENLILHAGTQQQHFDRSGKRTAILNDFCQDRAAKDGFDALHLLRKRETTIENEKFESAYDYDALKYLIAEKGAIDHKYAYDSIGNRLKKDRSNYKVNHLNELLEADGASYTFDPSGNLTTKTVAGKIWSYQSNPLNQLIQVKDPDQTIITFTYDPFGRRLTKKIESKAKKVKIYRYFYLGQTEIGCLDEKGAIVELKVPGNPNNPEFSPAIAFEMKGVYAPMYDLQGNVACLLDGERRNVVESYRYSAFGEEEIINQRGRVISESIIGNCWRYKGKRTDKEIGLIYFGKRYYDPEIGRWTSPDPLGEIDGPNLYAYVQNNPIAYVDYFGLASETNDGNKDEFQEYFYGEYEPHCFCERHRNCKRGGDVASAIGGAAHGVVDFMIGSLLDLQTTAAYIGSSELELSGQERSLIIETIEKSQARQMAFVGSRVMGMLAADPSDTIYQSFRSNTKLGLEISSLVAGGYGAVKGAIAFNRLARMPTQITKITKLSTKQLKGSNGFLGHKGFELKNASYQPLRNKQTNIQGRSYSAHALDQMQNRGFTPSVIEETIQNGASMPNKVVGRTQFYDRVNNISVITEDGKVVTVMYGRPN